MSVHPEPLPYAFGRYLLFDHIGRGGMADIYLARVETGLGTARRVVIKKIRPELSVDPVFSHLLIAEAKIASCLSHPNIVQVFDLGRERNDVFIGMEYVEGFDLHQLLVSLSRAHIPLPAELALFAMIKTLSALDYAHNASGQVAGAPAWGVVHRDVSPSNVLVSFEGEVKLCDFGLAAALTTDGQHLSESPALRAIMFGKSAYMAPEQARGERSDARADVFAAGLVLWELCAGHRYNRGTDWERLERARVGNVPRLPERGLPAQHRLQQILDAALAYEPSHRCSAGEMHAALLDYVQRVGLVAPQSALGEFLTEHFRDEIVSLRRARERAARGLSHGHPGDSYR